MKSISYDVKKDNISIFSNLFKMLENTIPNSNLKVIDSYEEILKVNGSMIYVKQE